MSIIKVIDAHTHVGFTEPGDSGAAGELYKLAEQLGYDKINVLSLQCIRDLTQNHHCALCKIQRPEMTYAFGGLDYATGRDYLQQAKNLIKMGFDGIKMLEGKPTTRKQLGMALDDEAYDPYYSFLEETGFPVLFHVADPATFWDREKAPGWAVEHGWLYDESDVPYEQLYTEVENMLRKHPLIRGIFAHFYFLSDDRERAQRFLDCHPNVSIDITAGIEMYENFSKDPEFWREFFIKNANRIVFGTDSTDTPAPPDSEEMRIDQHSEMELRFLRTADVFPYFGTEMRGLGLPDDVLEKILSKNFMALAGEPKPMNIPALLEEAELLRGFIEDENELKKFDGFVEQISK